MDTIFTSEYINVIKGQMEELQSVKDTLNGAYWKLHAALPDQAYQSRYHQFDDAEKLGKIASSIKAVNLAMANLTSLSY